MEQPLSGSDDVESSDTTGEKVTHGLSALAEAALHVLDDHEDYEILEGHSNDELPMISLRDFSEYLDNQPSVELLQKPNAIVAAPE